MTESIVCGHAPPTQRWRGPDGERGFCRPCQEVRLVRKVEPPQQDTSSEQFAEQMLVAFRRVALAGRELGSGPAQMLTLPPYELLVDALSRGGMLADYAAPVALGVVVGVTMAQTPQAEAALAEATRRWQAEQ